MFIMICRSSFKRSGKYITVIPRAEWMLYDSVGLFNSLRPSEAYMCQYTKLTTIGSDKGLSPGRRQAIIWANAGIL